MVAEEWEPVNTFLNGLARGGFDIGSDGGRGGQTVLGAGWDDAGWAGGMGPQPQFGIALLVLEEDL